MLNYNKPTSRTHRRRSRQHLEDLRHWPTTLAGQDPHAQLALTDPKLTRRPTVEPT